METAATTPLRSAHGTRDPDSGTGNVHDFEQYASSVHIYSYYGNDSSKALFGISVLVRSGTLTRSTVLQRRPWLSTGYSGNDPSRVQRHNTQRSMARTRRQHYHNGPGHPPSRLVARNKTTILACYGFNNINGGTGMTSSPGVVLPNWLRSGSGADDSPSHRREIALFTNQLDAAVTGE